MVRYHNGSTVSYLASLGKAFRLRMKEKTIVTSDGLMISHGETCAVWDCNATGILPQDKSGVAVCMAHRILSAIGNTFESYQPGIGYFQLGQIPRL